MFIQRIILPLALSGVLGACSHQPQAASARAPEPTAHSPAPERPPQVAYRAMEVRVSPKIQERCDLPDSRGDAPLFDFDRSELRARGETILDHVAACLQNGNLENEDVHAIGFADPRGTDAYNMELGARRAEAARRYLEAQGISAERIDVASCGKHEATGTDEASWAEDRRVELAVSDEALPSADCSFDAGAAREGAIE